jgi:stress-induced-phosphoprotein 1
LSAAQFEKGDYNDCIESCEKAVELGREQRVDYKLIGKALSREASAYQKLNDLTSAIKFYSKSLTENRTADTLNKLREVEKLKKDADDKAYQSPEIAEEEREKGNEAFKVRRIFVFVIIYQKLIQTTGVGLPNCC